MHCRVFKSGIPKTPVLISMDRVWSRPGKIIPGCHVTATVNTSGSKTRATNLSYAVLHRSTHMTWPRPDRDGRSRGREGVDLRGKKP